MTNQAYEELIVEGIKGLPTDVLSEIADFVYFVRRRALEPQAFEDELRHVLLRAELRQMSADQTRHLEQEWKGYDELHPHE